MINLSPKKKSRKKEEKKKHVRGVAIDIPQTFSSVFVVVVGDGLFSYVFLCVMVPENRRHPAPENIGGESHGQIVK